jgi:hypothetical protein
MTRRKFSREFKIEAVRLVTERGVTVAQACRDLIWPRACCAGGSVSDGANRGGLSRQWAAACRAGRDRSPEERGRQAQGGA